MRKFGFVAVTLLVFVSSVTAQHMWMADPAHSAIQFKVKHMGFSLVTGRFNNFEVTVSTQNKDDFTNAHVEITIQSNSIFTHHEQRDYHLRSDAFLNAAQYPTITFKSTSFQKRTDEKYTLIGDLTIRDTTKPVELDVELYGIGKNMQGKKAIAGFHVSGSINRFDYGVNFNKLMELGELIVNKTIQFDIDIELVL